MDAIGINKMDDPNPEMVPIISAIKANKQNNVMSKILNKIKSQDLYPGSN